MHKEVTLNALDKGLVHELREAFTMFEQNPALKVAVLSGTERSFSVGADISAFKNATHSKNPFQNAKEALHDLDVDFFAGIKKPIIASVSGYAVKGVNLCLFLWDAVGRRLGARSNLRCYLCYRNHKVCLSRN